MSTILPHGIIQINEGNIAWYGDITANWQLIDSKIGEYDAAVASIPAPANNGTLTINYGGTTIAMFGADAARNVSANIPAPGDGTLTVTQGGSTLGSFSANQATDETINIEVPDVNNGTLTIQRNGATVDTFTANSSTDKTVNIQCVDLSTAQTIGGTKTFDSLVSKSNTLERGTLPTETIREDPIFISVDKNNRRTLTFYNYYFPNGDGRVALYIYNQNTTDYDNIGLTFSFNNQVNIKSIYPSITETYNLGTSANKWKAVYSNAYYLGSTAFGDIVTHNASEFVLVSDLATVATSGSYNDLSNKPTIPTKTSDLTNDSGFLTSADLLPTGSYIQFAGSQAPAGFLVCNGGEISRTTYSALFAVIGTTYGSGDGSTTFNLPNLTDRFLQGSTTSGTVRDAGLPNITGSLTHGVFGFAISSESGAGAFTNTEMATNVGNSVSASTTVRNDYRDDSFDASRSSSIYGNSSTVQPPALTCLICIKY